MNNKHRILLQRMIRYNYRLTYRISVWRCENPEGQLMWEPVLWKTVDALTAQGYLQEDPDGRLSLTDKAREELAGQGPKL